MRSTSRNGLVLSAAEEQLVAFGAAMKVGACALVCALFTLIGFSAVDHSAIHASHQVAATSASRLGVAAVARRQLYEERRARFEAARGDTRATRTADVNNAAR